MDRTLGITFGVLIIFFVAFTGIIAYSAYTETAYKNTISGTYLYTSTITTDSPLYNVTLFLPVPADNTGNSLVVSAFSSRTVNGIPADWETTLFDTGKATLLKITTPAIIPPAGTSSQNPYTISFSSETTSRTPIDTRNPVGKSAMYRPVKTLSETGCSLEIAGSSPRCFSFSTSLFADYTTAADTFVTVNSSITGKNTWAIFGQGSNEYHADIGVSMKGEHHGWAVPDGRLSSGTGSYDIPEPGR